VLPVIEAETLAASSDPATRALEIAHALAFRSGLGSSIFAPAHGSITAEDVKSFAESAFSKHNIAVLGTGIQQSTLSSLVEKSLGASSSSTESTTSPSKYFGGESRIESHTGLQTVFIGFGAAGAPTPEYATLAAHLSPQPSVKWCQGLSPISDKLPVGTSVHTVHFPYSDATLVGLLIQGTTAEGVKEAGKAAVKALKDSTATGGIKADELKKAIAKAKFTAASAVDSREGLVSTLGPRVSKLSCFAMQARKINRSAAQVLGGTTASLDSALASFDKVTASAFSKVRSSTPFMRLLRIYFCVRRLHPASSRRSPPTSPSATYMRCHMLTNLGYEVGELRYELWTWPCLLHRWYSIHLNKLSVVQTT
jgi:ubiquinol-cytochrome c reductase core subunit 2